MEFLFRSGTMLHLYRVQVFISLMLLLILTAIEIVYRPSSMPTGLWPFRLDASRGRRPISNCWYGAVRILISITSASKRQKPDPPIRMVKISPSLLFFIALLAGCSPVFLPNQPATPLAVKLEKTTPPPVLSTARSTFTFAPTQSFASIPSATPLVTYPITLTQLPTPTPTAITLQMCSPLQDLTIADLFTIVSTPFKAPPTGQDSGHQGVDFAYYHMGKHTQMLGLPIYSVFTGKVAAVILNRPPYGNMVMIETPLDGLPGNLIQRVEFTPLPTLIHPDNRLTCPVHASHPEWSPGRQSLYLLYAHLNQAPLVKVGDQVACGGQLGGVGSTGESGNPHLHLETRLGPAGATFAGMSHYNTQATSEEMDNYCTWRISGTFQMFDPLKLLALGKN